MEMTLAPPLLANFKRLVWMLSLLPLFALACMGPIWSNLAGVVNRCLWSCQKKSKITLGAQRWFATRRFNDFSMPGSNFVLMHLHFQQLSRVSLSVRLKAGGLDTIGINPAGWCSLRLGTGRKGEL